MLMCSLCCLSPCESAARNINSDDFKTNTKSSTLNNSNVTVMQHLHNTAQSRQYAKKSVSINVGTMKAKFHFTDIIRTLGRSTAFGMQQRMHSQS